MSASKRVESAKRKMKHEEAMVESRLSYPRFCPTSEIHESIGAHSLRLRQWVANQKSEVMSTATKKLKEKELQLQALASQYEDLLGLNRKYKSKADGLINQVLRYKALARYLRDRRKYDRMDYGSSSSSDGAIDKTEKQEKPKNGLECKVCEEKIAAVMMSPCPHVCVCKSCDDVTEKCPLCETMKTKGVEVSLPMKCNNL